MRKKIKLVALVMSCVLIYGLFAMGSGETTNASTTVSGGNAGDTAASSSSGNSSGSSQVVEEKKDEFADIHVYVTDKKNVSQDIYNGIYTNQIWISFKVENRTNKTIRGVQGEVYIKDMFGDRIMASTFELVEEVGSMKAVTIQQKMDVNEFMDSHVEFWNTDYKDLTFETTVTNVIYK